MSEQTTDLVKAPPVAPHLMTDRFYGMEKDKYDQFKQEIIDFRRWVEVAWSKSTVKKDLKHDKETGRFKSLGQCAVTARLLKDVLLERYPSLITKNVIGRVTRLDGSVAERHAWLEVTGEKDICIIDVTPDQREGLGEHAPKAIVRSQEALKQDGYLYEAQAEDTDEQMIERGSYERYLRLKHRYERVIENQTYYHHLLDGDIFIVGPAAAGKTELALGLQGILRQKAIDVGKLFRAVSYFLLQDSELNAIQADMAKVKLADPTEIKRIIHAIFSKTRLIEQGLNHTQIEKNPHGTVDVMTGGKVLNEELETEDVTTLVPIVAQNPKVRELVMQWVWRLADRHESVIITGHTLKEFNLAKYKVIHLTVDETAAVQREMEKQPGTYRDKKEALEAVRRRNVADQMAQTERILKESPNAYWLDTTNLSPEQLAMSALKRIARRAQYEEKMHDLQEKLGIGREKFVWEVNPIIAIIRLTGEQLYGKDDGRTFSGDIFREIAHKYQQEGITEFDLAIQTMIHLTAYPLKDIWYGDIETIQNIVSLIKLGETNTAYEKLFDALHAGLITLNLDLVRKESEFQAQRIKKLGRDIFDEYFQSKHPQLEGQESAHPFVRMGDTNLSPFKGIEGPVISVGGKPIRKQINFESGELRVKEQQTGKSIVFKSVPRDISTLYGKAFHYLHEGRGDEYEAFGAYIEGESLPYAWVSYAPVDRLYKKEMLIYYGIEPHAVLEMTRAWNAAWSPKNTMSVLFTYAHEMLRHDFEQKVKQDSYPTPLKAIVTAINPNLGFRANAFNGIGLIPLGLKPAQFTFVNVGGRWEYFPRRKAQEVLQVRSINDLYKHPLFKGNQTPLLPTYEMVLVFDEKSQKRLRHEPVYQIPASGYLGNKM